MDESAAVEHGDPVGGRHRFGLIMSHIDRGDFEFLVQPANFEAHLFAQIRVQIAQRLVHQKNLRLDDQGASQRHSLLLSARQLGRITILQLRQMHDAEQLGNFLRDLGFGNFFELESVGDVLRHGHVRPDGIALKDHRHVAPLRRHRERREDDATSPPTRISPRIRLQKTGEQTQRRGLAATGRTEQRDEFAVADFQVESIDGSGLAKFLGQSTNRNESP